MPGKHAILSPSGAHRWLTCTPSARFELDYPDSESEAAREGTLAHYLYEVMILRLLGRMKERDYDKAIAEIKKNDLYDPSMWDYCESFTNYVMEQYVFAKENSPFGALIYIEEWLDLREWVPESDGTGDTVIVFHGGIRLIDFKYGKGVLVSAQENKQCMLYGLGAYEKFGMLFQINRIEMTIYQPRLDNIDHYLTGIKKLLEWAEKELKPKALIAWKGEGEYTAGAHCKFCRGKVECKAHLKFLELEKKKLANKLTNTEMAAFLHKAPMIIDYVNTVKEYALKQAMQGNTWPGWKLVKGRSARKYIDEKKIIALLVKKGWSAAEITELKGITALEKILGKTDFGKYLNTHLVKLPGAPTLVTEDDKREAVDRNKAAMEDFKNAL